MKKSNDRWALRKNILGSKEEIELRASKIAEIDSNMINKSRMVVKYANIDSVLKVDDKTKAGCIVGCNLNITTVDNKEYKIIGVNYPCMLYLARCKFLQNAGICNGNLSIKQNIPREVISLNSISKLQMEHVISDFDFSKVHLFKTHGRTKKDRILGATLDNRGNVVELTVIIDDKVSSLSIKYCKENILNKTWFASTPSCDERFIDKHPSVTLNIMHGNPFVSVVNFNSPYVDKQAVAMVFEHDMSRVGVRTDNKLDLSNDLPDSAKERVLSQLNAYTKYEVFDDKKHKFKSSKKYIHLADKSSLTFDGYIPIKIDKFCNGESVISKFSMVKTNLGWFIWKTEDIPETVPKHKNTFTLRYVPFYMEMGDSGIIMNSMYSARSKYWV